MNKAVPILVVATGVASIACMHLVRELREEKARGDALQSRIVELERAAAQPTPRTTPFSAAPSEPAPVDAEIQVEPPAPPTTAERSINVAAAPLDRTEQFRRHFERQRERLQDPQYRDAMRVQYRLGIESSYPHIASELGLSEQETDQFLDLLAEHQVRGMEQQGAFFFAGARPDEAAMLEAQQLAQQRQRQQETELETLLGVTKYQKWQEYQQTLGQRHRVASMQSSLAVAGHRWMQNNPKHSCLHWSKSSASNRLTRSLKALQSRVPSLWTASHRPHRWPGRNRMRWRNS